MYIEFPEEVLLLRVEALEKHVTKMEVEFFSSFSVEELEDELDFEEIGSVYSN